MRVVEVLSQKARDLAGPGRFGARLRVATNVGAGGYLQHTSPGCTSDANPRGRSEAERKLRQWSGQVVGISDVLATLEAEHDRLNEIRVAAVRAMRGEGLSYDQIAKRTGLSKSRIAQLFRAGRQ